MFALTSRTRSNLPIDSPTRGPNAPPPPPSAFELVAEADFQSGDLLITKRHWGAFAGTDLEKELKQRGIETVVLTGISSNVASNPPRARGLVWDLRL
jgi:isochorismate hydrolase